jgi:hypothetical protein
MLKDLVVILKPARSARFFPILIIFFHSFFFFTFPTYRVAKKNKNLIKWKWKKIEK